MFDIVAPLSAPQIFRPAPESPRPPRLDWIDQLLLDRLADAGSCPTWTLLNAVEAKHPAGDRTRGRLFRLQLWERVKRLRRMGLLFSVGRNRISATKPDPARRRAVRRRRPTVAKTTSFSAVSAIDKFEAQEVRRQGNQVQIQMDKAIPAPNPPEMDGEQTQSAEEAQRVSEAASTLAHLPRNQPRKMTGWLRGRDCWRGRLVIFEDGVVGELIWANRGRVLVYCQDIEDGIKIDPNDFCAWQRDHDERLRHFAVRERDVQLYKRPEAVLLGARKAGIKERSSLHKRVTCRLNGTRPVRPGHRPRGRPYKAVRATDR